MTIGLHIKDDTFRIRLETVPRNQISRLVATTCSCFLRFVFQTDGLGWAVRSGPYAPMLITAVLRPVAVWYELVHVVVGGTAIRAHTSAAIAQHFPDKLAIQSVLEYTPGTGPRYLKGPVPDC